MEETPQSATSREATSEDTLAAFEAAFAAGRTAFEAGRYRESVQQLEIARALGIRNVRLNGDVQIWLVTAYEANGQRSEAIALCQQLSRHPDLDTRKQSSRLLYILKAPKLATRPEWLVEIPDMATLDKETSSSYSSVSATPRSSEPPPPRFQVVQPDRDPNLPTDNRFMVMALVLIVLTVGGLFWLS